jgi:pyridoxamine 5'-phosphate oxidase
MNKDFTPPSDPWALFSEWFILAQKHEPAYPDAMTLATLGEKGTPVARTVLMKSFDERGVVFHTNRESHKGRQLAAHPKAGICFYWKSLQRQIHLEGAVSIISAAESDAYFASRARGSQIGAWASLQSRPLDNRTTLEKRIQEFEQKYEGQTVPRPPHWGGYRLAPDTFEFWQEQTYRLHDRIAYKREADKWIIERRYP